jgi:1,4-alpha-glucan branching enzyme
VRRCNELVHAHHPGAVTIAEESTAWPMVSGPIERGGLGFDFKWNMGWMHDMVDYFKVDPIYRKYRSDLVTFGIMYAWNERFVLPFSHDEVVYGKGSMLRKMPGDRWQQFANVRALYALMYAYPGKKLLFMGGEFAQYNEWTYFRSLDWHVIADAAHAGVQRLVRDINLVYRQTPALFEADHAPDGFRWIAHDDHAQSVASFLRFDGERVAGAACVLNATPVVRRGYRIGVPSRRWREIINTDLDVYGGSGICNAGVLQADPIPMHGHPYSLSLTLPPLAVLWLLPSP